MKYVVKTPKFPLNDSQKALAKSLGISQDFLRLLLGRGLSQDDLYDFLHPSIDKLSSPFEIDGIRQAVERINLAIERKEKVLIYGDYDCDGICAISTLMLYLKDKLDVFYFIPDRNKDGYGISVDTLKRILYNKAPKLVITVDCGITAVDEVEYLKSQGIDVIVTDHHEPQEKIPDCIVIDPKVQRKGFYDLCGAGVALKLVEALSSREEACKYFDIVAIATIADVVPLKDDNRIIAYYGLKQISTSPRKGVRMLLDQDKVSAQDVMFRLAPRMNAAGRLNSAMKVVGLFLENDYFLLKTLTEELNRDNSLRQSMCEKAVQQAKSMLKGADFANIGLITLYSESWEAGILGIACSRLVEEFKRPVVLFSKTGDVMKGSARSVDGINIFELFCQLSNLFEGFGGHAQAAGVSIRVDNFEEFKKRANEIVLATRPAQSFTENIECEMCLDLNTDLLSFAKELELLEPTGLANPLPTFLLQESGIRFDKIGFSQHIKYGSRNFELIGFSRYGNCLYAKTGDVDYQVVLKTNEFQNRVFAQGVIESLQFRDICISQDESKALNLHQLAYESDDAVDVQPIDDMTLNNCLDEKFGTLVLCFSQDEYQALCNQNAKIASLPKYISSTRCLNPENCVVVCPSPDFDLSFFTNVVIAGRPLCNGYINYIKSSANATFRYGDITPNKIVVSDNVLRSIYKEIATLCARTPKMSNLHKMYILVCSRFKVDESVFNLAVEIFKQLKLVDISDRGIVTVSKKAVKLQDSVYYRNILH